MTTITKESITDTIEGLEQLTNRGIQSVYIDMAIAGMRRLLASLEAEPVAWTSEQVLAEVYCDETGMIGPQYMVGNIPLYRHAQPAPVAPEECPAELSDQIIDICDGFVVGDAIAQEIWNAIRAAMLQGADGNSPVNPDGSEDTKRLDWLEAQNKRLNEYYGTTYGWKFDANFQRNAMMLNDSNYPVMTVRQAIDEAIAAAPKQEAE
ncbi:TPA: hypothetical protein MDF20_000987 [Citrobacter sedlakii]|uniref:hypothetical protein n=1 Tax=Citrobacter sedlakii TaxID=67826 RepID=UPI003890A938|nr:hypothetical protein [Citrobacter sedlakii]